jgi:hypothetical protein
MVMAWANMVESALGGSRDRERDLEDHRVPPLADGGGLPVD